ncbi:D-ribose-binding periplasmic protein [Quillaja saponaria]|uniref:D-ribose-binding periplasmic protein n=1 Tax=Quillaja saponaria TaxID=32244 RepID=A0AAD7KU62_QUISA|nr:D-ribose-binding periplasmic protein [Quillaja saponaria]
MGNCQAIDAATLVIQHPNGKVDKLYWPVFASEIMKMNPGHYVALLISTTTLCQTKDTENCSSKNDNNRNPVRLTRIKLLKPTDSLVLGQVYRLITTQEVMKGLWAKKQAKMRKNQSESAARIRSEPEDNEVTKSERDQPKTAGSCSTGSNTTAARSRTLWQPSLQSISEAAS